MTPQTPARKQKAYRDRMKALGRSRVEVWVPKDKVKEIKDLEFILNGCLDK